jgi:putative membrane protein
MRNIRMINKMERKKLLTLLSIPLFLVFLWSAIRPYDWFTWWMEVAPALIGLAVLAATYRKFPFTNLCYTLICVHMIILIIGGHYTYARVPAFDWLKEFFHWQRNHYDRVGHFAQGFIPAIIVREIFIKMKVVRSEAWRFFLVVCVCLAMSAFYEFIEWWTALLTGEAANDFLGSQGDVWDSQWDMFLCFIGSILSQLFLRRIHDRSLKSLSDA